MTPTKEDTMNDKPTPIVGDPVRVHKNLHNGKWSVRMKIPSKGWRVVAHVDSITIANAVPKCSISGAQRVRDRGVRAVVACIEGVFVSFSDKVDGGLACDAIHFNPFRSDHFTHIDGSVFNACKTAIFPRDSSFFVALRDNTW